MAWEWVAPVATAAGASAGVLGTVLTARGGRRHAETIARETNAHAERMARSERQQERLEAAYGELMRMAEATGHWASRVFPMMDTDPPQPVPALPSDEEQIRVRAAVRAYGSTEVNNLMDEYYAVVHTLNVSSLTVKIGEGMREGGGSKIASDARIKILQDDRPAEVAKRRELAERVAAELRGDAS